MQAKPVRFQETVGCSFVGLTAWHAQLLPAMMQKTSNKTAPKEEVSGKEKWALADPTVRIATASTPGPAAHRRRCVCARVSHARRRRCGPITASAYMPR